MDRKEFISLVGVGTAALFCQACLGGCAKDSITDPPTNVDFTVDLTAPENASLVNVGGSIIRNSIIVMRTSATAFAALSSACTHEGTTVQYDSSAKRVHCASHGSNFNTDGSVINGPARSALKQYTTTLNGNSLRVSS